MMTTKLLAIVGTTLLLTTPGTVLAQEAVGILTLDAFSFISFGDKEVFPLPPGSTIRFEFAAPQRDGSIPFKIRPSGVAINPVTLDGGDGELRYSLASTAAGSIQPTTTGRRMAFTAAVTVARVTELGKGAITYSIPFTTESAEATSLNRDVRVERQGARIVDGTRYVQLAGATVNKANAYPEPGTAVYAVLSGSFDRLP